MKRLVYILPVLLINISFAAQQPAKPKPAQSAADVIRAQAIELTDSKGNVRASMKASDDGPVVFKLFNEQGKASVSVDSDGGITILNAEGKPKITVGQMGADYGVTLYDSTGKARELFFIHGDQPYLSLSDGADKGAACVMSVKDSEPRISMRDKSGIMRSTYTVGNDGSPGFMMADKEGYPCLKMFVVDGLPAVEVLNPLNNMGGLLGFVEPEDLVLMFLSGDDKVQAEVAATKGNGAFVTVDHSNGKLAATLGVTNDGRPYLRTADQNGGTLWQQPQ